MFWKSCKSWNILYYFFLRSTRFISDRIYSISSYQIALHRYLAHQVPFIRAFWFSLIWIQFDCNVSICLVRLRRFVAQIVIILNPDRHNHYSPLQQNTSVHAYDGCIVMYTNVHTRTQATQIRDSCYVVPIRSRSDRGFYLDIIWTYSRTISRDRSRYLKYVHRNRIVSKLNKLHSHVSTRITSYMYLTSELFWISMIH